MIDTAKSQAPTITDDDFKRFREMFYRKTGIWFEESRRYFVDKRLQDRIKLGEHRDFRSWFTKMRFQASGEEFQDLVNAMTVNETYFFREDYQLECLVESALPEVLSRKPEGESLRIWSIPCSTGEEPFSIVLWLIENWPSLANVDVELVGSDIDTDVLDACRKGRYGERSVSRIPLAVRERYFDQDGPEWVLKADYRDAVEFRQVNLSDPSSTMPFRGFDVVFCRNLLIYFDDASRRAAANVFFHALRPGGFIFLGHTESMARISPLFGVRRFPKAIIYQKPEVRP